MEFLMFDEKSIPTRVNCVEHVKLFLRSFPAHHANFVFFALYDKVSDSWSNKDFHSCNYFNQISGQACHTNYKAGSVFLYLFILYI